MEPSENIAGMELGDHLGFAGIILALLGIGITIMWPTKRWIAYLCFVAAIALGLCWGVMAHRAKARENVQQPDQSSSMVALTKDQFQELMAGVSKNSKSTSVVSTTRVKNVLDADLQFVFYGKEKLMYMYKNPSGSVASKPRIGFGLLDLTNPYIYPTSPEQPASSQDRKSVV